MATQTYYLSGEVQWAKVHSPDKKYGKCSIDLKPDEKSLQVFRTMGLKNKVKDNGFITFRRDPAGKVWEDGKQVIAGNPKVIDMDDKPSSEPIGNGSECIIKVVTYDYNNDFGKGKGSRLEAVKVNKLVKFDKDAEAAKASNLDGMF